MPFVSRTRATLRSAECGFFGVCVMTRVHTPRFCGAPRRAGVLTFALGATLPFRTSGFTVGMYSSMWALTQQRSAGAGGPCQPEDDGSERPADRQTRKGALLHGSTGVGSVGLCGSDREFYEFQAIACRP